MSRRFNRIAQDINQERPDVRMAPREIALQHRVALASALYEQLGFRSPVMLRLNRIEQEVNQERPDAHMEQRGIAFLQAGFSSEQLSLPWIKTLSLAEVGALGEHGPALIQARFTHDQLVQVVRGPAGPQGLRALVQHGPALIQAGMTPEQLDSLVINAGKKGIRRVRNLVEAGVKTDVAAHIGSFVSK